MNTYKKILVKGLPKHYTFETLLYNQSANMIIAQIEHHNLKYNISQLYYRKINEKQYHKIECGKDSYSYDSVISSTRLPKIYFNIVKRKKIKDGRGGNWVGIKKFDLVTKKTQLIFKECNLILKAQEKRAWISDLISVGLDESIFCKAAFMSAEKKFETARKKDFKVVRYYLCRLNTAAHRLERLTLLRGVFL